MNRIEFEESVTGKDLLYTTIPTNACLFYTFPGGVISIILILTMIVMVLTSGNLIIEGYITSAIWVIFGTTLLSLFTMYISAYLVKGCKAANLIKEHNNKVANLPINK